MLFKPEFDSIFQVGVALMSTGVSSLSLRERARVRVLLILRAQRKNGTSPNTVARCITRRAGR